MKKFTFVDSHCHLNMLEGDLSTLLLTAREQGVIHMLCVSVELDKTPLLQDIAAHYSDISISVGLHPTERVEEEPSVETLIQLSQHPKVVAIGETGLDYYRVEEQSDWQQERFRRHIRAAKQLDKAIIVHSRNARADTIRILKEEGAECPGGVMHCFTEDWDMAKKAIDLNFYISFSGIVTFKNAVELQKVAKKIPLDRLLIETDAPFLAPIPHRGKPNQPGWVRYVAEFIAELRGVSLETIAEQTTANFFQLFKSAKQ
ncbi:MAG: TatD family hydrolase [Gammaproteobacteria bacterium]